MTDSSIIQQARDVLARQGNALALDLPDGSVDLIITSPPYFGQRVYEDDGRPVPDQVGAEATPAEFVEALLAATREAFRVLTPTGSLWINLGDKYASSGTLHGTPWRFAIAAADRLGLVIRQEVVWSKPNKFVDSRPRGRFRRTHETWFHLTRDADYYSDIDALRVAPQSNYQDRPQYRRAVELFGAAGLTEEHRAAVRAVGIVDSAGGRIRSGGSFDSESGRLAAEVRDALGSYYREFCGNGLSPRGSVPGSVHEIAAHPFKVPKHLGLTGHFASFPIEWPSRLIEGWCPPGGTVLDPFGGTGTTAAAAALAGRKAISIDLSADYTQIAQWRIAAAIIAADERMTS